MSSLFVNKKWNIWFDFCLECPLLFLTLTNQDFYVCLHQRLRFYESWIYFPCFIFLLSIFIGLTCAHSCCRHDTQKWSAYATVYILFIVIVTLGRNAESERYVQSEGKRFGSCFFPFISLMFKPVSMFLLINPLTL